MTLISAIFPIRNRSSSRLMKAASSMKASAVNADIELIFSDYGSQNGAEISEVAEAIGARYVRVEADYWNKPDCLNRAIAVSNGDLILCADIDILWHPTAVAEALAKLKYNNFLAFQSRDLPENMTEALLDPDNLDFSWEELEKEARLHSTWGNGILFFPKQAWAKVGGYDERLSIYGVEDLDFCRRLQQSGYRFVWSNPERSRIYHVWHPKVSETVTEEAYNRALERNRGIWQSDKSLVRNATRASCHERPLVSTVISTQNRADLLRECLASILCQTVQSFEIIVVDDGGTDHTAQVVESFNDKRIKYVRLEESKGISAARNIGTRHASGQFIAVMDDDDICLPDRFEVSLNAIGPGIDGCVGAFITFFEDGKTLTWNDAIPTLSGAFGKGGFSGHPTWMIRKEVFDAFGYDESFSSAVDNNLAMRMLNSGIRLVHSRQWHILRRVHPGQITNHDSQFQGYGASLNRGWLWSGYPLTEMRELRQKSISGGVHKKPELIEAKVLSNMPDAIIEKKLDVVVESESDSIWLKKNLEESNLEIQASVEVWDADGALVYGKYRTEGDWMTRACFSQRQLDFTIAAYRPVNCEVPPYYSPYQSPFSPSVPWLELFSEDSSTEKCTFATVNPDSIFGSLKGTATRTGNEVRISNGVTPDVVILREKRGLK